MGCLVTLKGCPDTTGGFLGILSEVPGVLPLLGVGTQLLEGAQQASTGGSASFGLPITASFLVVVVRRCGSPWRLCFRSDGAC